MPDVVSYQLTNCALTTLPAAVPESIGQLQALETLGLRGNRLTGEHLRSISGALTPLPAALPDSIGQLQALTFLDLSHNKIAGAYPCSTNRALTLACTELPSTIGNLKALETLGLMGNALTGEHLRSTNCASDPSRTRACSAAVHDRQFGGAQDPLRGRERPDRYVLL